MSEDFLKTNGKSPEKNIQHNHTNHVYTVDLLFNLGRKADVTDMKIKITFHFTMSKHPLLLTSNEEKSL